MIDAKEGDNVIATPDTGVHGDTITLDYTLVSAGANNMLSFSGVEASISNVTSAGTGERTYTVNATDADDGIITIIATFTHTNLILDPIAFENTSGHINITYGDNSNVFTIVITNTHKGSGDITYTSSNPDVATVNVTSGVVTILKVGYTTITAYKAADSEYAHAYAYYILSINRAAGAAVTQPTVSGIPTHNSITVSAVTLVTATGQEIEYAIAQVNNAPPSTWQPGTTFIGLTPNATYYVYARSKESANYNTGAFNVSAGIRTAAQGTFPIDFAALVNLAPEIEGPTIFRSGGVDRTTATLVVDNSGQYDRVTWLYRGQPISGQVVDSDRGVTLTQNGADLTLSANPTGGFSQNFVTLEVRIGTMIYSKLISFTVR
jgi:hypothetical protein